MGIAAPRFYDTTVGVINLTLFVVFVVITIVALVHCLMQRADAFAAINTFSKGMWLAILGGCLLFTLLGLGSWFGVLGAMVAIIPVIVVLVYLLDVRPALRDAVEGHGSW